MKNIPRPEHPNPMFMRNAWVNLNGEWQFEIDNGVSGEDRGLHLAKSLGSQITLPFCPESRLSGVGNTDFMLSVWYKRTVTFTEGELSGKRVILHFGAADFETTLWVNGVKVGFSHVGGYGSFEYDITDYLFAGENLLTVRCYDDTRDPRQGGGKQSPKYYSHVCYYTRVTGIWQTVWYEIVPECYIKSTRVTPDLENGSVNIEAELSGVAEFEAEVFYEGRRVGYAKKSCASPTVSLEIPLSEIHPWELGCGRLYDVTYRFGKDTVKSYFGLRSVALRDGKFYLNGKSVFQRLILDQGYYEDGIYTAPTNEALIRDIECAMSAGFNGARLHQKVFEQRFLYHADRLGYMVWGEYGNWGLDYADPKNFISFIPDWLDIVKRDYSHPSIIGWCPFNEVDAADATRCESARDTLRRTYELTKQYDPTRPCIDTSGWYHAVTDIYDVHDYTQNPETLREHFSRATEGVIDDLNANGRQSWDGKAPLFVSEYGGIGLNVKNTDTGERLDDWSYGVSCSSYEEFYSRYEGQTQALLDNPRIMGFCYTQLTDVEQEKNGLFNFSDRSPKYDTERLARINRRVAAVEK